MNYEETSGFQNFLDFRIAGKLFVALYCFMKSSFISNWILLSGMCFLPRNSQGRFYNPHFPQEKRKTLWLKKLRKARTCTSVLLQSAGFHYTTFLMVSFLVLPSHCFSTSAAHWNHLESFKKILVSGASLVAQWLRTCLPMQGTRVRALVWEDLTCRGATGPVSLRYWACVSGACAPQRERPRQWEARTPRWRVAPACRN